MGKRAVHFFRQAVDLDTEDAGSYNALGEAFRGEGSKKEAQSSFERALQCDSTFIPALRNLGALLIELGHESEGVHYYRRAAALGDSDAISFLRSRGINWDQH